MTDDQQRYDYGIEVAPSASGQGYDVIRHTPYIEYQPDTHDVVATMATIGAANEEAWEHFRIMLQGWQCKERGPAPFLRPLQDGSQVVGGPLTRVRQVKGVGFEVVRISPVSGRSSIGFRQCAEDANELARECFESDCAFSLLDLPGPEPRLELWKDDK